MKKTKITQEWLEEVTETFCDGETGVQESVRLGKYD